MSSLWSTAAPTPSDGHPSLRPQQRRIPRGDDFWDALSNHYDYLMDDQLITSCREADYELSLCPDEGMSSLDSSLPSLTTPLPPFVQHGSVTLTAKQLLQKLREVLLWLQEMEARIDGEPNIDRQRSIARSFQNDLETFNESKDRLLRDVEVMSPSILEDMKAEVFSLSNQLTACWKRAEDSTRIHHEVVDNDKIFHDVKVDMRALRRWLRDMETRLPTPKSVPSYWTLHDLKTKLENQKTIQAEIEAKGNLVKSLLKRCEQLRALEGTNFRASRIGFGLDRVARTVTFLEKRWQTLWLTSLEWQCLVEQLLDSQQDQPVAATPSISSGDTWDEPRNKLPRLDLTLNPRGLQEPRGITDNMEVLGRSANDPKHASPLKHKILNQDGATALNQPFATQLKRPPSGNYEGGQDVGYSSESSTQLSTEEKPDLIRIYSFTPESTTPESPDMPSRDSGLSGGGSPRKFPLSSKCSPIDDTLKEVIDEDYISSPGIRISGSAADFYTLTTPIVDSDGEAAKPTDLDDTLTTDKDSCSPQTERHSVTIDDQVVQLRRKPASRLFAPLEFDERSENNNNPNNKASRVKEWLQSCEQRIPAVASVAQEDEEMTQQDSCDASGELTNESDSDDGDDRQRSTATLNAAMSAETIATPTAAFATPSADSETTPKVNLRSGQKRRSRDRPWSVTELQGQIGGSFGPKSALSTSTSMTALNDPASTIATNNTSTTIERKRHSRASKAKESALSGSESDDNVSVATGTVHKRNSSTTSLINLCEAFPANTKEKTTPVRKKRLGSKILKAKTKCTGYSSANETAQGQTDQVASDCEKKCPGDQGSVVSSDNMWDDYQDPLYYSEHYSEKEMDDETMKRLLNFGDDYRSFIGSTSDTSSLSGLRVRSGKKKAGIRSEESIRDSESEQEKIREDQMLNVGKEDVNEILNRSSKAFACVSNSVKECLKSNNSVSPNKLSEMEAKCLHHLQCLQIIKIRISIAPDSTELLRELIERWQLLLLDIQSRDSKFSDGKLNLCDTHKLGNNLFKKTSQNDENVREDIDKLRDEMSQMESLLNGLEPLDDRSRDCWKFDERIAALKRILASLQPLKSSLLFVKVKVHRLAASKDDPQSLLTASVHDLYNTWDSLHDRTCRSLTDLQQSRNLLQNIRRSYSPQITDVDDAEPSLIYEAFTQMELCKPSVADLPNLTSAIHLSAMNVDQDYDSNYESGEETPQEGNSIWRIFKAALPFQVALVMLYCVAYLMEPHCCDVSNSWQSSFGPQLRYEQGHPPV